MSGTSLAGDGTYPDHLLGVLHLLRRAGDRARRPGRGLRAQPRPPLFQGRLLHQGHPRRAGHHLRPRTACSIPCAAPARAARASGRASPGTRRWTRWPTGLAAVRQKYGPEAIVGATSGAYFSRSVILALDAALDRLAQLDDQPGPVRRLPRRQRAHHGPRHHPRRGHRQHALRADRRPQPQHRRSGRMGRAQGRQEARRAHDRDRPQAHAGGADGRPVARPARRHRRRAGARHDRMC